MAAVLRFNRPDQLNAINWDTQRELAKALASAEADPDVRAVLITGTGRGFSAGGDITAYRKLQADPVAFTKFVDEYCRLVEGVASMTKPVVALVNGICAAGGTELLLACDFAWAAESARIGDMHINFAQIGGAGALARLPDSSARPAHWNWHSPGACSTPGRRSTGGWSTGSCRMTS